VLEKEYGDDVVKHRMILARWFPGTIRVLVNDRPLQVQVTARYPDADDEPAAEFDIEFLDLLKQDSEGR